MRLLPIFLFGLLPILTFPAAAQSTCTNPFEGESVRFSVDYWEKTDFCQHSVAYSEIISGGPPPDGIPPIDNPIFESIETASEWLQDQSPVIALEINGEARAYPLAILIWHEIANDEIGGVPVAVTFCPLCNSAVVFDRRVDGQTLRFGVSGNLRKSDLIMWDDVTQSWWQQFTGEAIVGAYTGTQLELLPSLVVGFREFANQYPDGQVLSRETSFQRDYGSNPYSGYDTNERPFLFSGELDVRLFPTARVLAGVIGGEAIAYPFDILREKQVINDIVGEENVVAFWQPGAASALDQSQIDESLDVGMAALYSRDLNGETLTFTMSDEGVILDEQTGSTWNMFGTAIDGELQGSQLQQILAFPHFWFAWAAFRPETAIYGID
jgi:Protein of unknown function (DUF3179)